MRLIDNAGSEFKRLWSVRVGVFGTTFWTAVGMIWTIWPGLVSVIPLGWYFVGAAVLCALFVVSRIVRQDALLQDPAEVAKL